MIKIYLTIIFLIASAYAYAEEIKRPQDMDMKTQMLRNLFIGSRAPKFDDFANLPLKISCETHYVTRFSRPYIYLAMIEPSINMKNIIIEAPSYILSRGSFGDQSWMGYKTSMGRHRGLSFARISDYGELVFENTINSGPRYNPLITVSKSDIFSRLEATSYTVCSNVTIQKEDK